MKIRKLLRLNQTGFGHHIIVPVIAIIAVTGIGVRVLTFSHAATTVPLIYAYVTPKNTGQEPEGINSFTLPNTKTSFRGSSTTTSYSVPQYSPDGNYLAWGSDTTGQSYGQLNIENLNTNVVSTYDSPLYEGLGYNGGSDVPIAWFPNSSELALELQGSNTKGDTTNNIYTVNINGTGLTEVPNIASLGGADSMAVTGDGKYIVFSPNTGKIYAVDPGSQPITLNTNSDCFQVTSRPGTNKDVSYLCNTYSANSTTSAVTYQTVGSAPTVLYSSKQKYVAGNAANYLIDEAWSNDGSTLALQLTNITYHAQCSSTNIPEIATLSYSSPSSLTVLEKDPSNTNDCKGGPIPGQTLAWSPGDKYVAYMDDISTVGPGGLYYIKSTPGSSNTPQLIDGSNDATAMTW
jgi:hypothetical protein